MKYDRDQSGCEATVVGHLAHSATHDVTVFALVEDTELRL
ncbi:hypothetical protein ANCCAN_01695 [Ancylostoma caninum]|uniref:Uncharacterized protein n=1 Tax=Ancylostoma caninum TaxID=29170 RepID=A0A368H6P5_ANCCA|nr:hypothetical protein ANCCAN_01695 [Ancylostoma caninum]